MFNSFFYIDEISLHNPSRPFKETKLQKRNDHDICHN